MITLHLDLKLETKTNIQIDAIKPFITVWRNRRGKTCSIGSSTDKIRVFPPSVIRPYHER